MRKLLALAAIAGCSLPAAAQIVVVTVPPSGSLVTKNSVEIQGLVVGAPGPAPAAEVFVRTRYPDGSVHPPVNNRGAYEPGVLGWGYEIDWDPITGVGTFSGRGRWMDAGSNFIDVYLPSSTLGTPDTTVQVNFQQSAVNVTDMIAAVHPARRTIDVTQADGSSGAIEFLVDMINTTQSQTYNVELRAEVTTPDGTVVELPMGGPGLNSAPYTVPAGDYTFTSIVNPELMTFSFDLDQAPFPQPVQEGQYRMELFVYDGPALIYLDEDVDFWVVDRDGAPYRDVTEQTGLDKAYLQGGSLPAAGNGMAAFDYNNDGLTDLFVCNPSGEKTFLSVGPDVSLPGAPNYLMRNNGDGTFTDVAAAAGVQGTFSISSYGATWGDVDRDGDNDLFVANRLSSNTMYANNDDGTFTNVTQSSFGGPNFRWHTNPRFGDIDDDGDLDLYVGSYMQTFDTTWELGGFANQLYRNALVEGQMDPLFPTFPLFQEIPGAGGADDDGLALAAFMFDYNQDGHLDIAVHNDFGAFSVPNSLYQGDGNGGFIDVSAATGYDAKEFSMGASAPDLNGDGWMDSYSTNIGRNSLLLNQAGTGFQLAIEGSGAEADYMVSGPQADGLNLDDNWGVMAFDFDLDQDTDLYVAGSDLFTNENMPIAELHPDSVFQNDGSANFVRVEEVLGLQNAARTHSAVMIDFEGDGDMDIVTSAENEGLTAMRNDLVQTNSYLTVQPVTYRSAPGGFNTIVSVTAGAKTQNHEIMAECAHGTQGDNRFQFGLGANVFASSVLARWTSGGSTEYNNVVGNQFFELHETVVVVEGEIDGSAPVATNPSVSITGRPGHVAVGLIGDPQQAGGLPIGGGVTLDLFPLLSPPSLAILPIGAGGSTAWPIGTLPNDLAGLSFDLQAVTIDPLTLGYSAKSGLSSLTVTP
jgi:hypothetical protein